MLLEILVCLCRSAALEAGAASRRGGLSSSTSQPSTVGDHLPVAPACRGRGALSHRVPAANAAVLATALRGEERMAGIC